MDKQQFATLAIGIKSAYPASKILEDNVSMDFWYAALKDIPYDIAENAVMELICTNTFPPNIAEIRKACMERCKRQVLNFDDAWGTVQKAIGKFGANNPDEAFDEMDDLTASVVKNLGWTRLCCSENQAADRANFREAYTEKANKIQNNNQLPEFVSKKKAILQEKYIPEIEEKKPKIENRKVPEPIQLTDKQIEERAKAVEEFRRRTAGESKKQ